MDKKSVIVAGLLFLMAGYVALEPMEVRAQTYGKAVPAITQSFAAKQLNIGDTWKIYLNVSDPDGDLNYVVATIYQPGYGIYAPSFIKIAEGNGKGFSGYVYLNTIGVQGFDAGNITLHIQIRDKAGHLSPPVSFPLNFSSGFKQEEPPQGIFKENDLGPIMVTLKSILQ